MLYPSIFGENLFDDFFRFPDFGRDVEKKLYGKHAAQVMKTDVHEHDDHYEIVIDLPGFKKDQINLELQNGYLTVSAAKGLDKDEKSKKGKLIRQERYAGAMQRSFYIGDTVTEADVKAKFEDGVLNICVPKAEPKKLENHKYIDIEGYYLAKFISPNNTPRSCSYEQFRGVFYTLVQFLCLASVKQSTHTATDVVPVKRRADVCD